MKEKILAKIVVAFLETAVSTMSATAGCLFADCIELKIRDRVNRKHQKKTDEND